MSAQRQSVVSLGSVFHGEPDWRVWPLARALRLRVVVQRDEQGRLWALTPQPDDVLLREAVSRTVAQPLHWRHADDDTLALMGLLEEERARRAG